MVEGGSKLLYPTAAQSELENELQLCNYPNPFAGLTTIQFQTVARTSVSLAIFDQTGRKVASLLNEVLPSGNHEIDFDGSHLPQGLYFYQLKAGDYSSTRKMIIKR